MSDANAAKPPAASRWTERQSAQIGELLVQRKLLTAEQLESAAQARVERFAGRPLADVVVEMGLVSRRDVISSLASAVGIPFLMLSPRHVRRESLSALPQAFCEENNLLPLSLTDGWLTVAAEDFANVFLVEEIARISGQKVQIVAAEPDAIRRTRTEVSKGAPVPQGRSAAAKDNSLSLEQAGLEELTVVQTKTEEPEEEARDLEAAAAGSPIVRLVNYAIKAAVEARASDIHIEPGEHEFQIRYRIDGDLCAEALRPPIRLLPAVVSRIKIMAGLDISERRLPQDGGMTVALSGKPVELRVSTMATTFGEKVVIRVLDHSDGLRSLAELGFSPALLKGLRQAISAPNGIVLVTGPTGSGKSTTLYAALAEIASPKLNISSIEDPVEMHVRGVNHFQVNSKTGFTFARALRSMLRQDPDVLMVGEIRDAETAKLATEAALTGHLVLSTLHTNDAPSAIPRLINMGVESYLVAASLRAVLAQRLVKRVCPHCRRRVPVQPALRQVLAEHFPNQPIDSVYQGAGCDRCNHSGVAGRTGIHELLLTDEEMLQDLGRDASIQGIRKLANQRGFSTLLEDCLLKLREGTVDPGAVYEVAGHVEVEPPAAVPEAA